MNQTPTKYQNPINNFKKNNKVGLINQTPTKKLIIKVRLINQTPTIKLLQFDISFFRCYMSLLILICHGDIRLAIHPPSSPGYFPGD